MSSIGEQIATAREARGLTTSEVAKRLHIRSELVRAIESEDWARVGPPSYARGFVRSYARLVGMNPDALSEGLDAAIPRSTPDSEMHAALDMTQPNGMHEQPSLAHAGGDHARSNWYPWLLGAMSMLATILVVAVLYYTFAPSPREASVQVPAQTQATNVPPAAPQDVAIFNGGNAGVTQPNEQKSGVDLTLQLTQASWLSVTVDGKRVVYQTLPAGTVRDFHGAREITLRAGNAGGVNAVIDGQPLGTLGQHGQVEERSFAAKSTAPSIGPRE